MSGILEWIDKYQSQIIIIIAFIALFGGVPYWLDFIIKWLQKGRIETLVESVVSIGYLPIGPVIHIDLSLVSKHSDIIISKIEVTVTNIKTSATHTFIWASFRPRFGLWSEAEFDDRYELPAAFSVMRNFVTPRLILFRDKSTYDTITERHGNIHEHIDMIRKNVLTEHDLVTEEEAQFEGDPIALPEVDCVLFGKERSALQKLRRKQDVQFSLYRFHELNEILTLAAYHNDFVPYYVFQYEQVPRKIKDLITGRPFMVKPPPAIPYDHILNQEYLQQV